MLPFCFCHFCVSLYSRLKGSNPKSFIVPYGRPTLTPAPCVNPLSLSATSPSLSASTPPSLLSTELLVAKINFCPLHGSSLNLFDRCPNLVCCWWARRLLSLFAAPPSLLPAPEEEEDPVLDVAERDTRKHWAIRAMKRRLTQTTMLCPAKRVSKGKSSLGTSQPRGPHDRPWASTIAQGHNYLHDIKMRHMISE
ncbi:uncharacterized protein LOC116206829 [Punica granatum]|uniref:Uncharacterized protein LOC116206829 n=1 Tax=Punica granatum TaxID=22663 RepID=A0A6P8DE51_PUNGR|nr:uncharacterized protein LOC116206829 [Punica granatum]